MVALTLGELEELTELFNLFDADRSGAISVSELFNTLQSMGVSATEAELFSGGMIDADSENYNEINFNEFCKIMIKVVRGDYDPETINKAFRVFDMNGDGQLTENEIQTVSKNLGDELGSIECYEIIRELSLTSNTYLTLNDFLFWMKPIVETKEPQAEKREE